MISTDTAHVAPTLHNPQSFVDDDARVDSIAEEWIGYWGGIEANDNDHYEV